MKTDAWLSMAVYTVSTVAFYLLGAVIPVALVGLRRFVFQVSGV